VNVLVTGGTGFVGTVVVSELHRAGHKIHLLARDARSPKVQEVASRTDSQIRAGDVIDSSSLAAAAAGMDAVIHLVGIISEAGRQTFERVHTEGTRHILEAARQAGVKRFVHMSALGTRPDAVARYHKSKWAAEELVRASGLEWTLFRPSIIYGPGDGFVNLFARIARRSPVIPIIGNGESKFQPIAVGNVAKAFVAALTNSNAKSQNLDLAGGEVFTLNQIVDEVAAAMNRKRLKVHLPIPLAMIQAACLEFLFRNLMGRPSPLSRDQVLMLQEDNVGDGRPADELFELKHGNFREGIRCYLTS
jgi:uncharacterized protein YbjT (DUF2867 family)